METLNLADACAKQWMNPDLLWVETDASIGSAMSAIAVAGVRSALVRPAGAGHLPGILTVKDVVRLLDDGDVSVLDDITVADVMTQPVVCVQGGTPLTDCLRLMSMTGVRRLPVLDGIEVVGMLSATDVFLRVARAPVPV